MSRILVILGSSAIREISARMQDSTFRVESSVSRMRFATGCRYVLARLLRVATRYNRKRRAWISAVISRYSARSQCNVHGVEF